MQKLQKHCLKISAFKKLIELLFQKVRRMVIVTDKWFNQNLQVEHVIF